MVRRFALCVLVLGLVGAGAKECPHEMAATQLHDANGVFLGIVTFIGISDHGVFDRQLGGFLYAINAETAEVRTSRVLFDGPNCSGSAFYFVSGPRQVLVSNSGGTGAVRYWAGLAPNEIEVETVSRDNGDGTCQPFATTSSAGEVLELSEVTDSVAGRFDGLMGPLVVR